MKSARYIADWYRLPSRRGKALSRPRELNFPITDNCNARCVMCNVWKENVTDDLSAEDISSILKQDFFQDLQHVGLSGGEPMLRQDILEIIGAFLTLPDLKSISVTSHGFNTRRHEKFLEPARRLCSERGVTFVLNLSLDGIGVVHDKVRGIPGGFEKTMETLRHARSCGIAVRAQCTVSRINVFHLPAIQAFAEAEGLDVTYRAATRIERLGNSEITDTFSLSENERSFFADFLESDAVVKSTRNPARRLFYKSLVKMLVDGAERTAPCYYQNEGALLSSRGELFHCSISEFKIADAKHDDLSGEYFSPAADLKRQALLNEICRSCVHDQAGAWSPWQLINEQLTGRGALARVRQKAKQFLEVLPALFAAPGFSQGAGPTTQKFGKAVIIGCYGGEHVGDAAILGGVLKRHRERHGTASFVVCSSRPHRTKRWARELDLPVDIQVVPYSVSALKHELRKADYLAIGGGPIMDLPLLLLRHSRAFQIAKSLKKPILIEGVGFGPFRRSVSRMLAKRLITAADRVTVRTSKAHRQLQELRADIEVTRDPAFDYLGGLASGKPSTHSLVRVTNDRPLIALNLRPLWSRYATAELSESDVRETEVKAVSACVQWIKSRPDLNFIFLPMNADQYGMSDLGMGNRLAEHLAGDGSNFKIWEAEPGIQEVYSFLKQCDALIAMRFHACIFGISAGIPVLGIDYGLGKLSKVAELMQEEQGEYISVEDMTTKSLKTAFAKIAPNVG